MAEYLVNDTDMTAVADAIRTKGGLTDALVFPDGYVSAVGAIVAGGGDPYSVVRQIGNNKLEVYDDPGTLKISGGLFYENVGIREINAPNITEIGSLAFAKATNLTSVTTENVTFVGSQAFIYTGVIELNFPKLTTCYASAFQYSKSLKKVDIGEAYGWKIEPALFYSCSALDIFILRAPKLISLGSTNAFMSTPIASGTGYIYVPKTLSDGSDGVATYQAATNWATYADQIRAIEDYPDITGG